MSAHDWPEFEKRDDIDVFCPANRIVIFDGSHREFALIDKAQYNYAKVRIDGYDALQQRCEELVDIAHECQKIIKELCACYSHHEPIATLERIEAIKQVQP